MCCFCKVSKFVWLQFYCSVAIKVRHIKTGGQYMHVKGNTMSTYQRLSGFMKWVMATVCVCMRACLSVCVSDFRCGIIASSSGPNWQRVKHLTTTESLQINRLTDMSPILPCKTHSATITTTTTTTTTTTNTASTTIVLSLLMLLQLLHVWLLRLYFQFHHLVVHKLTQTSQHVKYTPTSTTTITTVLLLVLYLYYYNY